MQRSIPVPVPKYKATTPSKPLTARTTRTVELLVNVLEDGLDRTCPRQELATMRTSARSGRSRSAQHIMTPEAGSHDLFATSRSEHVRRMAGGHPDAGDRYGRLRLRRDSGRRELRTRFRSRSSQGRNSGRSPRLAEQPHPSPSWNPRDSGAASSHGTSLERLIKLGITWLTQLGETMTQISLVARARTA